jgi:hypothetical protein
MKLVYYRGPEDVLYSFFWINERNERKSPSFTTEDEAKQWLIKSVTTTVEPTKPEPTVQEPPTKMAIKSKEYTDAYNAGKLFAELEFVELKQNILELIDDAKPSKLPDVLKRIKELLK